MDCILKISKKNWVYIMNDSDKLIKITHKKLAIDGGQRTRKLPMPTRVAMGVNERHMLEEALDYYQSIGADPGYQGRYENIYTKQFVSYLGGGIC